MTETSGTKPLRTRSRWAVSLREARLAVTGAVLYGVFSYLTNPLLIPGTANVSARPAVTLVFFFGLAFGPWVGFFTGFAGNMLADALTGKIWIWWDIGNGIMGLLPGLMMFAMKNYRSVSDLVRAEISIVAGAVIGMFAASVSEIWVSNATWSEVLKENFLPVLLPNIVNGLIVIPILMISYSVFVHRPAKP